MACAPVNGSTKRSHAEAVGSPPLYIARSIPWHVHGPDIWQWLRMKLTRSLETVGPFPHIPTHIKRAAGRRTGRVGPHWRESQDPSFQGVGQFYSERLSPR